jgi:hypothetical protein
MILRMGERVSGDGMLFGAGAFQVSENQGSVAKCPWQAYEYAC